MFELDDTTIQFYYNDIRYTLLIYFMSDDNYCMRLYKGYTTNERYELFSTWIDSFGGEVTGNSEVYTMDNIDELIQKCYDIYNFYVQNNMLTTGNKEED